MYPSTKKGTNRKLAVRGRGKQRYKKTCMLQERKRKQSVCYRSRVTKAESLFVLKDFSSVCGGVEGDFVQSQVRGRSQRRAAAKRRRIESAALGRRVRCAGIE